ncbi:MAG: CRISPR-associated protein Cas5 [Candidatus Bathyarchaeia archaeon]|jgi:CRISPR-associated Cas5-like protein
MVWVGARYRFASTFSYRIPYFSSSYALSAPAPSPSTIKLALVSSAINRTGNVNNGKELFNAICNAKVEVELPETFAVFKAFMKRLKKKRQGEGFERTFGIREYILYHGNLGVRLEIESNEDQVSKALKQIQYFGTSDSICSYVGGLEETNPKHIVKSSSSNFNGDMKGVIFLLSDFGKGTTFDDINPFSGKKLKKENLTLTPYLFPIYAWQKDKCCTVYKCS